MFEVNLFIAISSLCNFGGGKVVETVKCQKYYVWCLREQVTRSKSPGYKEGMLEVCVANMQLTREPKKPKEEGA